MSSEVGYCLQVNFFAPLWQTLQKPNAPSSYSPCCRSNMVFICIWISLRNLIFLPKTENIIAKAGIFQLILLSGLFMHWNFHKKHVKTNGTSPFKDILKRLKRPHTLTGCLNKSKNKALASKHVSENTNQNIWWDLLVAIKGAIKKSARK